MGLHLLVETGTKLLTRYQASHVCRQSGLRKMLTGNQWRVSANLLSIATRREISKIYQRSASGVARKPASVSQTLQHRQDILADDMVKC